jgi:exosome complex RNA-binding protein Csl4
MVEFSFRFRAAGFLAQGPLGVGAERWRSSLGVRGRVASREPRRIIVSMLTCEGNCLLQRIIFYCEPSTLADTDAAQEIVQSLSRLIGEGVPTAFAIGDSVETEVAKVLA